MTIRERADVLLRQTALMEALRPYGAVIVGSYAMDAMSWNDLDIYVDAGMVDDGVWRELTCAAVHALKPTRVDGFADAVAGKYFFGAESEITGERWNIDIWAKTADEIRQVQRQNADMRARFEADPAARQAMIAIKQALIERGMYGFDKGKMHYHSQEIYRAVLDFGVRSIEEFLKVQ